MLFYCKNIIHSNQSNFMSDTITEISTRQLHDLMHTPEELIVDIRPTAAYNGWRLQGELRGGHIPGAISFPLAWTRYTFELHEFLQSKGLVPGRPVTIYGYNTEEMDRMVKILAPAGLERLKVYPHFQDEWVTDSGLPLARLAHYDKLIYPDWLHTLINGGMPPNYDGRPWVLCHTHYDHYADYEEGHIPGAVSLNTLDLESPEDWNVRSPGELMNTLLRHGIRHDTTVILYGRFSYPRNEDPFPGKRAGHLSAMRSAAILMYAGVEDVRILNGSILAWEDAGYGLSKESVIPTPAADFGVAIPAHPEYITDISKAKELLASDDGELVCVRSWEEYTGKVSGYHYIEKTGRIPGAVFGNCGSDAYHMENYRNPDLTMRSFEEVAANWAEAGIVPEKEIAFYCGTGWRGSEAFLNAWLMGWPRVSVYDGGWMEWSSDPENPVVKDER